jgi:hypothetical protein
MMLVAPVVARRNLFTEPARNNSGKSTRRVLVELTELSMRYRLMLLLPISLALFGFSKKAGDKLPGCMQEAYRVDNAYQNWYVDNRCGGEIKVYYSSPETGNDGVKSVHDCKLHDLVVQTSLKDVVSIDEYAWTGRTASQTCVSVVTGK